MSEKILFLAPPKKVTFGLLGEAEVNFLSMKEAPFYVKEVDIVVLLSRTIYLMSHKRNLGT